MFESVHSSTVYNFPDLKINQMFTNNRIDLKIVVYSDSEIFHTYTETKRDTEREGGRKGGQAIERYTKYV